MPTKRTFDLIVLTSLLLVPAVGLLRCAARRWRSESTAVMGEIGAAVGVSLGK